MNLILFEIKKTWRAHRTYFFLSLGFLLAMILFLFNGFMEQKENRQINSLTENKTGIMGKSNYTDEIGRFLNQMNQDIVAQEEGFHEASDQGKSLEGKLTLPTYPFYRITLNNVLEKDKIPPESMRYGTKNTIFAAILLSYLASGFGSVLLLFLFGDCVTKEIEERSLYFFFSQPIRRGRLYVTKFILVWLQSLGIVGLLLVFGFTIASIFSGGSSFFYPVIVFTKKSMELIPIIHYMGRVFLVLTFVLAFCLALHFLISILVKKTSFSLVLTLLILFEGYMFSTMNNGVMRNIAHFNPFTYLNVPKVFIGYDFRPFGLFSIENQEYYANWCLPRTLHNSQINSLNGIMVLSFRTVILLILGYYCFKRNVHRWKI